MEEKSNTRGGARTSTRVSVELHMPRMQSKTGATVNPNLPPDTNCRDIRNTRTEGFTKSGRLCLSHGNAHFGARTENS